MIKGAKKEAAITLLAELTIQKIVRFLNCQASWKNSLKVFFVIDIAHPLLVGVLNFDKFFQEQDFLF